MAKDFEVELGYIVKDDITGFEGVATSVTQWLNGCRRIGVQSMELKDGKPIDALSFDEPGLTILQKETPFNVKPVPVPTGGPRPEPQRHPDASPRGIG